MLQWTTREDTGFAAQCPTPEAQDGTLHTSATNLTHSNIKIGALNVNGINEITKRQTLQNY